MGLLDQVKIQWPCKGAPPRNKNPVMEQLDEENHHDIHDEWLGRPEVRQQMREVCLSLMTDATVCMLQTC